MKKFISGTVIFFLPLFPIAVLMEVILRKMPNDYQIKDAVLSREAGNIEVLCLGSSHAFYGIDPMELDRPGFNAGYLGQTLDIDQKIFEKYRPGLKRLKFLLIPVSYFSFSVKLETSPEPWRAKNYIIYYGLQVSKQPRYQFEILTSPTRLNIWRLSNYLLHDKVDVATTLAGNIDSTYMTNEVDVGMEESGIIAAERHTTRNMEDSTQLRNSLQDVIRQCESMGVTVILFFPPAYKSYTDRLDEIQLASVRKLAHEADDKFTNTLFFDYLSDTSFTVDDFHNADHLNQQGSKKLTRKLNAVMNQLDARSLNP